MTLYLIRHAIAAPRGPEWPDDRQRPLTDEGAARMRRQTRGLDRIGIRVDRILSSPLVRTRQTAEILRAGLSGHPGIELLEALAPGGTPAATVRALAVHQTHEQIAVVGHEPDLGALAAHLIGTRTPIPFKKGGACGVAFDSPVPKPPGQLLWFLPPRVLRTLAGD